jgi:hypothetical protein
MKYTMVRQSKFTEPENSKSTQRNLALRRPGATSKKNFLWSHTPVPLRCGVQWRDHTPGFGQVTSMPWELGRHALKKHIILREMFGEMTSLIIEMLTFL